MPATPALPAPLLEHELRGEWVRLDTLTSIRWLAVLGQGVAVLAASLLLGLEFPLWPCLAVVGLSALANLASRLAFPRSRRLSEAEALLTLLFDTAQISLLLYFTGGLHNPFALLLLAPVTVAAAALPLRGTLALAAASLALTTLLAFAYVPLHLADGTPVELPWLLLLGFWAALTTGIAFIGLYLHNVARERHDLAEALLATQLALAREQKLTDLGGVIAAAAHELGTPLATIKLASAELMEMLGDQPELAEDARLIREQADRCREILRSMGRAGKRDELVTRVPLEALIAEAAAPHLNRGRRIEISARPVADSSDIRMPEVLRRPEILHGLRNLIQNAVDFAADTVRIEAEWNAGTISVRVSDDGPGYPPALLDRIGEPWLRERRGVTPEGRREYEGMGMGLFIAKTLLERTGAEVEFENIETPEQNQPRGGARAGAIWPRSAIEADRHRALGANQPVES